MDIIGLKMAYKQGKKGFEKAIKKQVKNGDKNRGYIIYTTRGKVEKICSKGRKQLYKSCKDENTCINIRLVLGYCRDENSCINHARTKTHV